MRFPYLSEHVRAADLSRREHQKHHQRMITVKLELEVPSKSVPFTKSIIFMIISGLGSWVSEP